MSLCLNIKLIWPYHITLINYAEEGSIKSRENQRLWNRTNPGPTHWYCEILDKRYNLLILGVPICKMGITMPASWVAVKGGHSVCHILVPNKYLLRS